MHERALIARSHGFGDPGVLWYKPVAFPVVRTDARTRAPVRHGAGKPATMRRPLPKTSAASPSRPASARLEVLGQPSEPGCGARPSGSADGWQRK
jgi:hypothetical protein